MCSRCWAFWLPCSGGAGEAGVWERCPGYQGEDSLLQCLGSAFPSVHFPPPFPATLGRKHSGLTHVESPRSQRPTSVPAELWRWGSSRSPWTSPGSRIIKELPPPQCCWGAGWGTRTQLRNLCWHRKEPPEREKVSSVTEGRVWLAGVTTQTGDTGGAIEFTREGTCPGPPRPLVSSDAPVI